MLWIFKFICYELKPKNYRKIITKLKLNVLISTTLQRIVFHWLFFWQIRCTILRQKEIWAMDTWTLFYCMYCCFKKYQQNLFWYLIQHPKNLLLKKYYFHWIRAIFINRYEWGVMWFHGFRNVNENSVKCRKMLRLNALYKQKWNENYLKNIILFIARFI